MDRKAEFDEMRKRQRYGPDDPMPAICSCTYKYNDGEYEFEFDRKKDGSWNRTCVACITENWVRRLKQVVKNEWQIKAGASVLKCLSCSRMKPLDSYRRRAREGGMLVFQKCNACARKLCEQARARHAAWKAMYALEIIEDFNARGCTGYGQGRDEGCPSFFQKRLEYLKTVLPNREFGLLFDYDHYTANGPIEDYQMVSQIADPVVRREHRSRCFLKCVYCHIIKTIRCRDHLRGHPRWAADMDWKPNIRNLNLKKERYQGQDRGQHGNCQGPNFGEICLFKEIFDELLKSMPEELEEFHFGRFFEWDHVFERRMGGICPSQIKEFARLLRETMRCALRCRGCHRLKTLRNDEYVSFRLTEEDFLDQSINDVAVLQVH